MKRFYCTVCKRVKRVEVMPASVQTPAADNPDDRVGQCRWHILKTQGGHISHREFLGHSPRPHPVVVTHKSAPPAKPHGHGKKTRPSASFKPSSARDHGDEAVA